MRRDALFVPVALLWLGWSATLAAADLTVRVVNEAGVALADAVVFVPGDAAPAPAPAGPVRKRESIVQRDRVFQPFVTVVERGTAIDFPNQDPLMHHVYSYSPAKHFEIKLYKGTPAAPVLFDKAGIVVVGCNVHDWMVGYVAVLDTRIFAKSGSDGSARLRNLAPGTHRLMVWYPGMREPVAGPQVTLTDREAVSTEILLKTPVRKRPPAPPFDPTRYSSLVPAQARR